MADVVVTSPAVFDVDEILSYLQHHAGRAVADAYRRDLTASFRRLAAHPQIGALRPGLGRGIRIVTIKPYVVIHCHDRARDTVFVLRVLHGRRRLALDAT